MRAIHIVPAIAEEASGPSYSVVRLCDSLIEAGEEVSLAALNWAPLPKPPPFLKTFPLGLGPRRLGRSPEMKRWLADQCNAGHVSVLHNHGMWQMNSVYPAWVSRRFNTPLINSPRGALSQWAMEHGSKAKRLFWPLFQWPALQATSCFHATAETEYEEIRSHGFNQPVAIIPNGIDIPAILAINKLSGHRRLLFLSRIHPKKGLENLLLAWAKVHNRFPDWHLSIVGSDDGYHGPSGYLEELRTFSSKNNLVNVDFPGLLTGNDKLYAYMRSDLFVLPTYSENFGMVVAEALSMGIPAIVTKGAPWSGIEENQCGWWIDVGLDPLVECLNQALSMAPAELAAMGKRGRAWMERDFSWTSIGVRMAVTYRWLCDRSLPVPSWVRLD